MTMKRKIAVFGTTVALLGITSAGAFAVTSYSSPAELVAGLTGKTTDNVIEEKLASGKTYGTIAEEAGLGTEFKAEMMEIKIQSLQEQVNKGTIAQERADEIIAAMEERQESCDGTGAGLKQETDGSLGGHFGNSDSEGEGNGQGGQGNCDGSGQKAGTGNGLNSGQKNRDGSCQVEE